MLATHNQIALESLLEAARSFTLDVAGPPVSVTVTHDVVASGRLSWRHTETQHAAFGARGVRVARWQGSPLRWLLPEERGAIPGRCVTRSVACGRQRAVESAPLPRCLGLATISKRNLLGQPPLSTAAAHSSPSACALSVREPTRHRARVISLKTPPLCSFRGDAVPLLAGIVDATLANLLT